MTDLTDRVFVITGGNGGIGLGIAEGIALAGGRVVLWGRNSEKNNRAVEQIEELGGAAHAICCDVADEPAVVAAMNESVSVWGRIDGAFANAGRGGSGTPFTKLTLDEWRAVMSVNLDGVFLTLREAARHLIEQGDGGSLVAVSSTSAIHGAAGNEAYGASKTAVNGLVRALAVGLARHRIRVNSLLPGWTKTELSDAAFGSDRFREATTRRTPVRRWAEPSDYRKIGAFLADPTIDWHTGRELCADGGYTIF